MLAGVEAVVCDVPSRTESVYISASDSTSASVRLRLPLAFPSVALSRACARAPSRPPASLSSPRAPNGLQRLALGRIELSTKRPSRGLRRDSASAAGGRGARKAFPVALLGQSLVNPRVLPQARRTSLAAGHRQPLCLLLDSALRGAPPVSGWGQLSRGWRQGAPVGRIF